ncbi:nuclear transport factor 2 family protein [Nocardia transvalensis]|uniref:nuclear transport factor 2 family protein n=1 Tax=Nocardia transvalensis TaxID=37333 RepID=UPI0018931719|nr:nuclear transport factor 2 family protein [Nocardia transvalensis]MBF6329485.1 nuclear transport factor 2 family protein [Nocardia transvalensis]
MNSGEFTLDPDAEPIESAEWLRDFTARYIAGWNAGDATAVAACVTEDTRWLDPSEPAVIVGRAGVAKFVRDTRRAFPDVSYTPVFEPTMTADQRTAIVPWRMSGTNLGPIDPPGFAATGKKFDLFVVDIWQFRSGLIRRSKATWDMNELLLQLELLPKRNGFTERALARAQRLGVAVRGRRRAG